MNNLHGTPRIQVVYDNGYDYEEFVPSNPTNPTDAVTHAEAHQIARDEVSAALATYITDAALRTALADYATTVALRALATQLSGFVSESDYNLEKATLESRDADLANRISELETAPAPATPADVAALARTVAALGLRVTTLDDEFVIDAYPRYATLDDLDGNFVFVFSSLPTNINEANFIRISFGGVPAYSNSWTPSDGFALFGLIPSAITNLKNNSGARSGITNWGVEVRFENRRTNPNTLVAVGRTQIVINRG